MRRFIWAIAVGVLVVLATAPGAARADLFYQVTNLVSDGFVPAKTPDANLVNPWGIAFSPTSFIWVADNGTGVSTLYTGAGAKNPLVVTVPPPAGGMPPSAPTGLVFSNSPSAFPVTPNNPARFIFSTEDGTISVWSFAVDLHNAIRKVDNSPSAVYKGLAIDSPTMGTRLYATNFRAGKVEVYDSNFSPILPGSFVDPNLPSGYAPFGIKTIGNHVYVTYALQDDKRHDDVAGAGHGFVDVYDLNGNNGTRLISQGVLNSPWGLALAPSDFGPFSNDLLVGNFGDSHINAFDPNTGTFLGTLRDGHGNPLFLSAPAGGSGKGLWALAFGQGGALNGPTNTLFFTSGVNDEMNGLFGKVQAVPEPASAILALVAGAGLGGFLYRRHRQSR
jgi:uncharacterized protein (TIGR03118 family)